MPNARDLVRGFARDFSHGFVRESFLLETTHDTATLDPSITVSAGAPTPQWTVIESDGKQYNYTGASITHNRVTAGDMTLRLGPASLGPYVTTLDYSIRGGRGEIFNIAELPNIQTLLLQSNSFNGDLSSWVLPSSLTTLRLDINIFSGDLSSWVLPSSLTQLLLRSNFFEGDISSWVLPPSLNTLTLFSNSFTGAPDISANTAIGLYRYQDNSLSQSDVGAVVDGIYQNRMDFAQSSPALNIAGNNAIVDAATETKINELVNDPNTEGFNTWSITYNAPA